MGQKPGFLKIFIPAFPETTWSKNRYFLEFSIHTDILSMYGKLQKLKVILEYLAVETLVL